MADHQNKGGPSKKRTYTTMIGDEEAHDGRADTAHTQDPVRSAPSNDTVAGDDLASDQGTQAALVAEGEHEDDDVEDEAAADADAEGEDGTEEQNDAAESEDEGEGEGESIARDTVVQGTSMHTSDLFEEHWVPEIRSASGPAADDHDEESGEESEGVSEGEEESDSEESEEEEDEEDGSAEDRAAAQFGEMLFMHAAMIGMRERGSETEGEDEDEEDEE